MNLLALLALLTGLALAPALIYVLLIWWLDRYEKEPVSLAVLAFVWGATPAIILALIFELLLGIPLALAGQAGSVGEAAIVAPVVEEAAKGAILFVLFLVYRREFDDVLDGILYGALVGVGFSVVENVTYGLRFAYPDGYQAGTAPLLDAVIGGWFLRSGVFGLNHAFFTSITGAALGWARANPQLRSRWGIPVLGLAGAMGFHALHNGLLSLGALGGPAVAVTGCLLDVLADWSGIAVMLTIVILTGVKERHWIEQQLWEEVLVGRLDRGEYYMLISAWRRWLARWHALTRQGWPAFRQVGRLQQLATELAFRKQQVLVVRDSSWRHHDIQVLRARIDDLHGRMARAV